MRYSQFTSRKARPVWHEETCVICHKVYDELSDPAASLHHCTNCLYIMLGIPNHDAPIQRELNANDWWDNFVYAYERDLALGVIDKYGRTL